MARFNPYTDLVKRVEDYLEKLRYAHTVTMWQWKAGEMDATVSAMHQRTLAAQQMGYDVYLYANDDKLIVQYKKKIGIPDGVWGV